MVSVPYTPKGPPGRPYDERWRPKRSLKSGNVWNETHALEILSITSRLRTHAQRALHEAGYKTTDQLSRREFAKIVRAYATAIERRSKLHLSVKLWTELAASLLRIYDRENPSMKSEFYVDTKECPSESEARMIAGTSAMMEIFDAHSDYTLSMRISVLAGALAIVTLQLNETQMVEMLHGFGSAVSANRRGLLSKLRQDGDRAAAYLAQLKKAARRE